MGSAARREVVLVEGLGLDEPGWHDVMWGAPLPGRFGRLLRAVVYARDSGAHRILLGSAGTRRAGRQDAEYALDLLRTGAGHLATLFAEPVAVTYEWVERSVETDVDSTDQDESLLRLLTTCADFDLAPTVLTSPNDLAAAVQRTIAKVGDDRFVPLRAALRFVVSDVDRPTAPDPTPGRPREPHRRSRR